MDKIQLAGKALMSGQDCSISVSSNNLNQIRFINNKGILADVDNVLSTQNCTVLGNEKTKVVLIEHFMAACAILNINSIDIEMTNFEMPIFDGSALEWVKLLKPFENKEIKETKFDKPIVFKEKDTEIILIPSDGFNVNYMVNFNHDELKNRWIELNKIDIKEIVEARTFGYLKDLEYLQSQGLALGVDENNTVGLKENGEYTTTLRSEFEPAKHKILDLIGDLYLSGLNPMGFKAAIYAKNAGHYSHVKFAKLIKTELNND